MTLRDQYMLDEERADDWRHAHPGQPKPTLFDHPLTPTVLVVIGMAVAFVLVMAVAGWMT